MNKKSRADLVYLIKTHLIGFIISTVLLSLLGMSEDTAVALSLSLWGFAGIFMWFFVHPTVKNEEGEKK